MTGRTIWRSTIATPIAAVGTEAFARSALYRATGALSLRAAAYTGLRVPTLNELYRPFVVFPVVTQANENLRNEHLRGAEIGIDFAPGPQWRFALTAFDNELRDAIANVTLAPDLRQRRNIDAVEARGIEATADARFGAFRFAGSAAYTDARTRGTGIAAGLDGFRPAQTPQFVASGDDRYRSVRRLESVRHAAPCRRAI